MLSSERIAVGTKLIVLRGGPPEWEGHETAVSKTAEGQLERWCHVADAALVFEPTDAVEEIEVEHRRRSGTKVECKAAQVYRLRGYREEIPWPGTGT